MDRCLPPSLPVFFVADLESVGVSFEIECLSDESEELNFIDENGAKRGTPSGWKYPIYFSVGIAVKIPFNAESKNSADRSPSEMKNDINFVLCNCEEERAVVNVS
jgi:hypothetical protein